jgi:Fic family protein
VTRDNVEASLRAVEQALKHFVSALEQAGFANGAAAYGQMADIIVGQWMWAQENDARDLQLKFLRISHLAARVSDQLRPYVGAMDQLRGIGGLAAELWGIEAGSMAQRIVNALIAADGGLTLAELRQATGASTATLRRELSSLAEKGLVAKGNGARGRFVLVGAARETDRT